MKKRSLGDWGESKAAEYLKKHGCRIVERNFSCRLGEIDIIASNREYIIFVEVKLRKNADFGEAKEFVTAAKQRKIITTAQIWLENNETELQPRFDVAEIYAPDGENGSYTLNYIEDAFE